MTRALSAVPVDERVQRAEYADLKVYLPNDVLVKVDRMSMAAQPRGALPAARSPVIELAFRTPDRAQDARPPAEVPAARARRTAAAAQGRGDARRALPHRSARGSPDRTAAYSAKSSSERRAAPPPCSTAPGSAGCSTSISGGAAITRYVLWAVWVLERWLRQQSVGTSPVTARDGVRILSAGA